MSNRISYPSRLISLVTGLVTALILLFSSRLFTEEILVSFGICWPVFLIGTVLVCWGMPLNLRGLVSERIAENDIRSALTAFRQTCLISGVLACIVSLCLFFLAPYIAGAFKDISYIDQEILTVFLRMLIPGICLLPQVFFRCALTAGLNENRKSVMYRLMLYVISVIFLLIPGVIRFLLHGRDMIAAYFFLLVPALTGAAGLLLFHFGPNEIYTAFLAKARMQKKKPVSYKKLRKRLCLTGALPSLISLLMSFYFAADIFMIRQIPDLTAASSAAYLYGQLSVFTFVFLPAYSYSFDSIASTDERQYSYYRQYPSVIERHFTAALYLMMPFAVLAWETAVTAESISASSDILRWLACSTLLYMFSGISVLWMCHIGQGKEASGYVCASLVVKIITAVYFSSHIGGEGLVLSSMAASAVLLFLCMTKLYYKCGIRLHKMGIILLRILIASFCMNGVLVSGKWVMSMLPGKELPVWYAAAVLSFVVYTVFCMAMQVTQRIAGKDMKHFWKEIIKGRL